MIPMYSGSLSRNVTRVHVERANGTDTISFDLVLGDGTIQRVTTTTDRLHAQFPTVFLPTDAMHPVSTFQAALVLEEAKRQSEILTVTANRSDTLDLIYRHTHSDYKGKLPDGTRTLLLATGLVALEDLSEAEISYRIPVAVKKENERKKKDADRKKAAARQNQAG